MRTENVSGVVYQGRQTEITISAAHDYVVKHNPNMTADEKRKLKGSNCSDLYHKRVYSRSLSIRHLLAVTIQTA